MMQQASLGIDFGTTNSSLALAAPDGTVQLARYPSRPGGVTASFRSLLFFLQHGRRVEGWSGPAAMEQYLDRAETGEGHGRLVQSLKSYLPVRTLTGTEIFGRRHRLEDLVGRILRDLREGAEKHWGHALPERVVVGRPVRFVGAETAEDETFALGRLAEALRLAGWPAVEWEYEPVAAAYAYGAGLAEPQLVLIGDFGGGTSDFSLLYTGPGSGHRMLGTRGVPLAGDAFDAKLVRYLVSPALGSGSLARSGTKLLPAVPAWIYANLERWHHLSFLRTRNVLEILRGARVRAVEPEKIEALLQLIDEDLGFQLHGAVQRVKYALSAEDTGEFRFREGSLDLRIPVTRAQFEGWVAPELEAMDGAMEDLLHEAGVRAAEVDRVFLTGGTSFVPAVRRLFTGRFGEGKVTTGEAFTSVAHGLALRALELGA